MKAISKVKKPASLSPFESLIVDISTRFIALPADRVDGEIMLAQQQVCECLGLDVSVLWQRLPKNPGSLTTTHIFLPPDFPVPVPEMDAKDTFPWSMERLFDGETIVLSRMADLPAAAARDLEVFRHYGIRSSLTFPLSAGGGPVFGVVSFNSFREERAWPTDIVDKLRIVAVIFANALAHQRADQALRESEARYRSILERSSEGIYQVSVEGRILFANPAAARILGYDSPEDLMSSVTDLGSQVWANPEERSRVIQMAEEGGLVQGYECQFRRKDGTLVWVSLDTRPFRGPDGRIIYSDGMIENIDEHKRAEKALQKNRDLLEEIERIGNVGGWEVDLDTMKQTWTAEIYSLHEVDPSYEPTVEKGIQFYTPASRQVIERLLRQAIEHGEPFDAELEIITAKGRLRNVLVMGRADLENRRISGFFQDITQHKQDEAERIQLRLELTHLARVLTLNEISASLAHEINQPLAAILANAETVKILLPQAQDKREAIPEIVDDIIQDARRAGDVVRKVRGIVKKGDVQFEPLRINALIEDVLMLLNGSLAMNSVMPCLDLKPGLADIRGDRVRLQQVLMNLVMNAIDAMKGMPSRILTIRSATDGPDTVTVSVGDSGPGIPEAGRAKVFQAFYTTKKDGLGLGLPICRSIIEEHGGRIWEDQNPGGGSTFSLSLKAWREGPA